MKASGKRIVFTTFGSRGDLHPYIAIAHELQARGHRPFIATSRYYQKTIEDAGVEFYPIRPEMPPPEEMSATFARVMDARRGTVYFFKHLILPALRDSFADLQKVTRGADALVTHSTMIAGPLVAQSARLPWVSCVLSPIWFFSKYDPPVLPFLSEASRLPFARRRATLALMNFTRRQMTPFFSPVATLRQELGLPPGELPLFEGQHSPQKVLALFSRALAEPQPDWPQQTVVTGFCSLDENRPLSAAAREFLKNGPPPLVFTLGASSAHDPGDFWEQSLAATKMLGHRALFLTGRDDLKAPAGVLSLAYEPLQAILPYALALIHHGGAGTIAFASRAGVPQLIMPHGNDQFDNGVRLARQGTARLISRKQFKAARVASALKSLLENPEVKKRCVELQKIIQAENGAAQAADEIESVLLT